MKFTVGSSDLGDGIIQIYINKNIKNCINIWRKDLRHYFLLLGPETIKCPETYLHKQQRDPNRFRIAGVDGINHYTLCCGEGWIKSLVHSKRIEGFVTILKQKLSEEGIQNLYPYIWLTYRNRLCERNNRTEEQHINRLRNLGKLPELPDSYVIHITQNMGRKEAAKSSLH